MTSTTHTPPIGRPRLPEGQRGEQKGITLTPAEWAALAAADPDGSATREAARRLRRSIATDHKEKRT